MFDNNINEEEIEIIDFEDTNNIQNPNNKKINELIDIKNKVIFQGNYPNKQVSYDSNNKKTNELIDMKNRVIIQGQYPNEQVSYDSNNKKINELIDMKNRVIIQGNYPSKQVNYDSKNNIYILSEEGFEDMHVSVIQNKIIPIDVNTTNDSMNTSNESSNKSNTISHQKTLGTHPGVGNHFHFGEDSGFMNALFFIFLTGLSTGVVFMIILNFFIK